MRVWNPLEIIQTAVQAGQIARTSYGCEKKYAIILLNQKVKDEDLFLSVWNEASLRIVFNGGVNQWYHLSRKFPDLVQLPGLVCPGDDSRRETLHMFESLHKEEVTTVPAGSDSMFAELLKLRETGHINSTPLPLIVFAESGTFQENMENVSALFELAKMGSKLSVFLMTSHSVTFVLQKGIRHEIVCKTPELDLHPFLKIRHCGFLPVGATESVLTTDGLEKDAKKVSLSMGSKILTRQKLLDSTQILKASCTENLVCNLEIEFDPQLRNV